VAYQPSDLPSRMASKIELDPESGCWLWTGSRNREGLSGNGTVSYQGKTDLVHRVVFRLLVGDIPDGFQVSHAEPLASPHAMLQPGPLGSGDEGGSSWAQGLGAGARPEDPLSARPRVHAGEHICGPSRIPAMPGLSQREGQEPLGWDRPCEIP
jgi:hypothetical protein